MKKNNLNIHDIDFVIQTHLHFDHSGNLKMFKNKKIYLQRLELEYIESNSSNLFCHSHYSNIKFEIINGDFEILPGLKLISTPGHTKGCQSIICETKDGLAGIAGFCCTNNNFKNYKEHKILTPIGISCNFKDAIESINSFSSKVDYMFCVHGKGSISLK